MKRDSFVFYKDWKEAIRDLPDDIRLEIYESVIEYATTGNLKGLKTMASIAFNFIKATIDRDVQSYINKCNILRENGIKGAEFGKLGGRPRGEKPQKTPNGVIKTPKNPKKPIDNDNVNDNDSVSDININTVSTEVDTLSTAQQIDTPEIIDYKKFIDWFNSETRGVFGLVKYPIGEKRKASIRARVRENGKQSLFEVIKKAYQSDFLKGNNKQGFVATLDWIIRPSNFDKILSGNYKNRENATNQRINNTGTQRPSTEAIDAAVEAGIALAAAAEK